MAMSQRFKTVLRGLGLAAGLLGATGLDANGQGKQKGGTELQVNAGVDIVSVPSAKFSKSFLSTSGSVNLGAETLRNVVCGTFGYSYRYATVDQKSSASGPGGFYYSRQVYPVIQGVAVNAGVMANLNVIPGTASIRPSIKGILPLWGDAHGLGLETGAEIQVRVADGNILSATDEFRLNAGFTFGPQKGYDLSTGQKKTVNINTIRIGAIYSF